MSTVSAPQLTRPWHPHLAARIDSVVQGALDRQRLVGTVVLVALDLRDAVYAGLEGTQ